MSLEPPVSVSPTLSRDAGVDQPASAVAEKIIANSDVSDPVVELPLVPIVLGVIGHREIPPEHRGAISGQFRAIFEQIRGVDPRTPVVLLTGLAEGADQLAATAALEWGVSVRAVLPFAPDIYRVSTSFNDDASRRQFDAFLKDPRVDWYVAPLPGGYAPSNVEWSKVATDREDADAKKLRYACYANVGGYIVRRCHALIAVWDGLEEDPSHPSGTAEHVRFKLAGKIPGHYPWANAEPLGFRGERGLVLAIHSPKALASDEAALAKVGELTILMPDQELGTVSGEWTAAPVRWNRMLGQRASDWSRFWRRVRNSFGIEPSTKAKARSEITQFREICQSVRDFNRDVANEKVAGLVRGRLVKNAASHDVPAFGDLERQWYRRFSRVREAAAEVSQGLRVRLDRMHIALFVLIGLSAAAFHFYAHWTSPVPGSEPAHPVLWLWVFVALILAAIGLVVVDWWSRLDQRRLDARALGEGLRVRRAWSKAGVGRSVADSYAGQLRGEFSWVRHALLHLCPPPRFWVEQFERLPQDQQIALLKEVRDEWIQGKGGQIDHFGRSHHAEHRKATILRSVGFVAAFCGWFLAMSLLWPAGESRVFPEPGRPGATEAHKPTGPAYPSEDVIILSSLLVIFGGLLIAYSERQGHEELARQYERMEILFRNADKELEERLKRAEEEPDDGKKREEIVRARRVIEELGREAITEHTGWYMLRRARSLELHIG